MNPEDINPLEGIPGAEFVEIIHEESGFSLVRANHEAHHEVIVILIKGEAAKVFPQCQEALNRWKNIAAGTLGGLAKLHHYSESPRPHIIAEDPGGRSLRQTFPEPAEKLRPRAEAIREAAKTISLAKTYDLFLLGLTPDTILNSHDKDAPWKILPVIPGARSHGPCLAGGRYAAPELSGDTPLQELSPDVYSLSWIAVDVFTGAYEGVREMSGLSEEIPYSRLLPILKNGMKPVNGRYDNPKMLQLAMDRWLKDGMEDDWREEKARLAALERTPWQQTLHENKGLLIKGVGALAALILLVLLVTAIPSLFVAESTNKTPYGVVQLYFSEIVERDEAGAKDYASGSAEMQTSALLSAIQRMENENLASPFASAVPRVAGDGPVRTAKIDLKGENGDLFMQAEVTLRQQDDETWELTELYFKPLRSRE